MPCRSFICLLKRYLTQPPTQRLYESDGARHGGGPSLAWQSVRGSESCTGGRLPPRPGWILAEDVRLVMSNLVSLDRVSTSVTHHGATTKHGAPAAFSCPSLPPAPAGGHGIAGRGPGDHQHWCHLHPHLPAGQLL